jgi:hypothetical protein
MFLVFSLLSFLWDKKWSSPFRVLDRPKRFQDVEVPRFQDNRRVKAISLSAPTPRPPLRPRKYYSFLSRPQDNSAVGRILSAIESASFRLVAQCLDQLCHRVSAFFAVTHNESGRILHYKFRRATVPFPTSYTSRAELNIENTFNIIVKLTLLHQGQVVYGQHKAVL